MPCPPFSWQFQVKQMEKQQIFRSSSRWTSPRLPFYNSFVLLLLFLLLNTANSFVTISSCPWTTKPNYICRAQHSQAKLLRCPNTPSLTSLTCPVRPHHGTSVCTGQELAQLAGCVFHTMDLSPHILPLSISKVEHTPSFFSFPSSAPHLMTKHQHRFCPPLNSCSSLLCFFDTPALYWHITDLSLKRHPITKVSWSHLSLHRTSL